MNISFTGPAAIACVLASAFLHALWNALLKTARDARVAATAVVAMCAAITALMAPFMVDDFVPSRSGLLWALGSGVLEGIYFITLARALKAAPLGVAYTVIRGGAMLLVWPVSVLVLHEPYTCLTALGALFVGVGMAAAQHTPEQAVDVGRRASVRLHSAYLCSMSVAGYHLCYDRALVAGMAPWALFALAMWVALLVTAPPMGRAGLRDVGHALRTEAPKLTLTAVICTVSFVLFLSALRDAGAGIGITLRNTSTLFAQGMAWAIGEHPHRWQIWGAVAVCTGAVLVGLGH